jgi:hypothetical protein
MEGAAGLGLKAPGSQRKDHMCLEMVNFFIDIPFAWLSLALIAVLVTALAGLYLYFWRSRKKTAKSKPSPGFTCPCYAPPWSPSEKERE